ncbi:MAG: DUF1688 family protein [Rhodoblastus sp.]
MASLDMFAAGLFSARKDDPLRADAERLAAITARDSRPGFRSTATIRSSVFAVAASICSTRLGRARLAALEAPVLRRQRAVGGLFDALAGRRRKAEEILSAVLTHLGLIWPSRLAIAGVPLGDAWRHPQVRADDATDGVIPFHKLSQWLSYSLIEPLQRAGVEVADIDGLTGLPEYRNGGLLVDLGALVPKDAENARRPQTVDSEFVVEWRALTVALLDEIAALVREELKMSADALPLAKVLEGGTWAAGRRIAAQKRADGAPPLDIVSDGTVF